MDFSALLPTSPIFERGVDSILHKDRQTHTLKEEKTNFDNKLSLLGQWGNLFK